MKFTIKSRKFGKDVTFSRPGTGYIYVDLNGQPGTLGRQICESGCVVGDTIAYYGDSDEEFKAICRKWWNSYLRREA